MIKRAKFHVASIERRQSGPDGESRKVRMYAAYNGQQNCDNSDYWQPTPDSVVTLCTVDPKLWGEFELGKEYYLTFEADTCVHDWVVDSKQPIDNAPGIYVKEHCVTCGKVNTRTE